MRRMFYCSLALCAVMGMMAGNGSDFPFSESMVDLNHLKERTGNASDIKLYCPDLIYIKSCQREALVCFRAELNVLDFEFDGTSKQGVTESIQNLQRSFDLYLSHLNASKSCHHCEVCEEKPLTEFLDSLTALMQFHNKISS